MEKLQKGRGTYSQNAVINFFKRTGILCKIITLDWAALRNGKEFTNHQKITEEIGVAIYFTNPYHSWKKENKAKVAP